MHKKIEPMDLYGEDEEEEEDGDILEGGEEDLVGDIYGAEGYRDEDYGDEESDGQADLRYAKGRHSASDQYYSDDYLGQSDEYSEESMEDEEDGRGRRSKGKLFDEDLYSSKHDKTWRVPIYEPSKRRRRVADIDYFKEVHEIDAPPKVEPRRKKVPDIRYDPGEIELDFDPRAEYHIPSRTFRSKQVDEYEEKPRAKSAPAKTPKVKSAPAKEIE